MAAPASRFVRSSRFFAVLFGLLWLASAAQGDEGNAAISSATPEELFERRIMPIFKSPNPASCIQCHLSAVDLKDYIRPSHEQTFASLRDQGLIDVTQPEKSKILTLIQMGEKDLDQGARMIHEKTRRAEYEAFASWIQACCRDPKLRDLAKLPDSEWARPDRPDEVIRHARKSRVVDSFVRNVWSQRMRCFPCHTPHELDESNPKLRGVIQKHKEFLAKHGAEFGERLAIFRETPEATLEYLIQRSREVPEGELPLINLHDPRKSLMILKPTSKLPPKNEQGEFVKPTAAEPVTHMGGLKMHPDDPSYKSFIAWIQDYARVVGDQYVSAADLPADNWFASKNVVMVREVPAAWAPGTRVQLLVHAWDQGKQAWDAAPAAFTQGTVTPVRNVAGALFLLGPAGPVKQTQLDRESARLPPGKYLLKAYVDTRHRLTDDPTVLLDAQDYFGQAEIDAKWREGFPQAERVLGKSFQ